MIRTLLIAASLAGATFAQTPLPRPAYAPRESTVVASTKPTDLFPIDLPTTLRLVRSNSPAIGVSRARVLEALARQDQAEALWLPNLSAGLIYFRLDGQTQNQRGDVFGVSRSNAFAGGGPQLRLELAEAIFQPLIARRLTTAAGHEARAADNSAQLEAALAYLELLQAHAARAINEDTLARAEQMLRYAKSADEAGLAKTRADVNRAQAEVYLRQQERIDAQAKTSVAAARLARLLLLAPEVNLVPADANVVPVVLVPSDFTLEDLIATAVSNRPDLAAERSALEAAIQRDRRARIGPFLPKATVDYQAGTFGGGTNAYLSDFNSRGVGQVQVYWELKSLGFGDAAITRERAAQLTQSHFRVLDVQARAGAEVVEAAKIAAAKYSSLDVAQKAVTEATELYRKLQATSFNMVGPRAQYDALEPLLAISTLNVARMQYLGSVIEFNKAQFRLYTAIGQPPEEALGAMKPQAVEVPVVPPPFKSDPKK